MKMKFYCEGEWSDIEVGQDPDNPERIIMIQRRDDGQDPDIVFLDKKQRDELVIALQQITLPGEELEEDDD